MEQRTKIRPFRSDQNFLVEPGAHLTYSYAIGWVYGMTSDVQDLSGFEASVSGWIHLVGVCIEVFGVFIIVAGIIWSTLAYIFRSIETKTYDQYKIRIGRSLLLGLEVLVAADIIKTIAIELTFVSLGLLAGLVVVRTFLSWTLTLEIEKRWPWSTDGK